MGFVGVNYDGAIPGKVLFFAGIHAPENLLVCDGAAVPANVGANPSLTIATLAERAMTKIPPKGRSFRFRSVGGDDVLRPLRRGRLRLGLDVAIE